LKKKEKPNAVITAFLRKHNAAFYKRVIDEIVEANFHDVDDPVLFAIFYGYGSIMPGAYKFFLSKQKEITSLAQILQLLSSIEFSGYVQREIKKILEEVFSKHPDYENERFVKQLNQFFIAIQDKALAESPSPADAKISILKNALHAANKQAIYKQEPQIIDLLRPQLEYYQSEIDNFQQEVQSTPAHFQDKALVYFTRTFSDKKLEKIAEYLWVKKILLDKQSFIDFFNQHNVQVVIDVEKILYYMEAIRHLSKKKAIRLNRDNRRYLSFAYDHIRDISRNGEVSHTSQVLSNLKRQNPPNADLIKDLRTAIDNCL
jgi:hypothetical protein